MTRIGVLADTHIPLAAASLPDELIRGLEGCDLVLHAGDLVELWVLEELEKIAPAKAVSGNMDVHEVTSALPRHVTFELEGFKFGMIHGSGAPFGIERRVMKALPGVDCLIFGHTHHSICKRKNGTLLVNHGSPTDKRFAKENSYAVITVGENLNAEIMVL